MGTIADKLQYLNDTKQNIIEAIKDSGINVSDADTFRNYPDKIRNAASLLWKPNTSWWDIEKIFIEDIQEGYTKRYIALLADTVISTDLSLLGGSAYKTSDGQFYTSAVTHTWNTNFDKACYIDDKVAYKTRYVIVYSENVNIALNHISIPSLYIYTDNVNITSLLFGQNTAALANLFIESIKFSDNTTASANALGANAFYNCYGLKYLELPSGITTIGDSAVRFCYTLLYLSMPDSVTSVSSYAFLSCYALQKIRFSPNIISIGDYAFQSCYSIKKIILPNGITALGKYTFWLCYCMEYIELPLGMKSIDSSGINGCSNLKKLILPNGLETVSNYGLQNNTNLTLLDIPSSLISFSSVALLGCERIKHLISHPEFNVAARFSYNNMLTHDSLVNLLNNLKDLTGETAKTLTLGTENLAKLTVEEKAIATNKNWTLA